jgi:hypothetical protein
MQPVRILDTTEVRGKAILEGCQVGIVAGAGVVPACLGVLPRRGIVGAVGDDQFGSEVLHGRFLTLRFSVS